MYISNRIWLWLLSAAALGLTPWNKADAAKTNAHRGVTGSLIRSLASSLAQNKPPSDSLWLADLGPWHSPELEDSLRLRLSPWTQKLRVLDQRSGEETRHRLQLRALKTQSTRASAIFESRSGDIYVLEFEIGESSDRQERIIVTVLGNWIDGILSGQEPPTPPEEVTRQREKELPMTRDAAGPGSGSGSEDRKTRPATSKTPVAPRSPTPSPQPKNLALDRPASPWSSQYKWSLWLGSGVAWGLDRGKFRGFDMLSLGAAFPVAQTWHLESRLRLGTQKRFDWRLYRFRAEVGVGTEPGVGRWAFPLLLLGGAEFWSLSGQRVQPSVVGDRGWLSLGAGISAAIERLVVSNSRFGWRLGVEAALRWSAEVPGFRYAVVELPAQLQGHPDGPDLFRIDGVALESRLRLRWGRLRRGR